MRDKKLEDIAKGCLDIHSLSPDTLSTKALVKVCDIKQALQLAYKAGKEEKNGS